MDSAVVSQERALEIVRRLREVEEQIEFNPGTHTYRFQGTPMKSVTSFIKVLDKPALNAWKVRQQMRGTARKCLEEPGFATRLLAMSEYQLRGLEFEADVVANVAADLGREVHALIEHWAHQKLGKPTKEPRCSDRAHFLFDEFLAWASRDEMTVLATELKVASAALKYTGTMDLLALRGGRVVVFDWKTKAGDLWPEEVLQLAAYRAAVQEWTGVPALGRVLRIPKDGSKVQVLDPDDVSPYMPALASFSACVGLTGWLDATRKGRK